VHSNEDFKCQERVLVRVLGLHNTNNKTDENCIWANHCSPVRSASGDLPEKDEWIYVMFPDKRDPMTCIWIGFVKGTFQNDKLDTEKLYEDGTNVEYTLDSDNSIDSSSVKAEPLSGIEFQ